MLSLCLGDQQSYFYSSGQSYAYRNLLNVKQHKLKDGLQVQDSLSSIHFFLFICVKKDQG